MSVAGSFVRGESATILLTSALTTVWVLVVLDLLRPTSSTA
ncbi:MAG: hypothetical protein ACOYXW_09810 [Actinomycetota bacterium]